MVHADFSNFDTSNSSNNDNDNNSRSLSEIKSSGYAQIHASIQALVDGQRNWVCNTANTASLLWHFFHSLPPASASSHVNWAGFYVNDLKRGGDVGGSGGSGGDARQQQQQQQHQQQLILGPFMGKVACQTIAVGRGVCGTVAASGQTAVVPDVHAFPGHIACDGDTKSEIVVPIVVGSGSGSGSSSSSSSSSSRRVVGVIDIDCTELGGFDDEDRKGLERVAELLAEACDW